MSRLIRTLNLIKSRRGTEWLTPSQVQALNALKESLRVTGTVNLYGSTGAGKTFLAWALVDELSYAYFPHAACFSLRKIATVPGVVIDNVAPDRYSHRAVLKSLQFEGVRHAVLITRELIRDYTYYVELSLSSEDWEAVRQNLVSIGHPIAGSQGSNLWHLVNPSLRRV
jgi:hypothetical protein